MTASEWFVVNKHAEEKCAGWREILQKTKRRKAQMLGSVPEPNLWHRCHNASAY